MNIYGANTLACTKAMDESAAPIHVYPAAASAGGQGPRARSHDIFTRSYASIEPYLKTETADARRPNGGSRLSEREKLDGLYECILCACCSTSCPSYWWNGERYLGPAALLQSYRWLVRHARRGHRRPARQSRRSVPALSLPHHHELRPACPKGLNPAKAIAEVKKMMVKRRV